MKLGDWVRCTRYISKSGNRYEIVPAEKTINNTETALYYERGVKEPVGVEDFHDCERVRFVDKQFDGVYVGTTTICRRLQCSYEEPEYGRDGYYLEKYDPITAAIVYYAQNKKRLVPLDSIQRRETKEP